MESQLLTAKEAAARLNVSRRTLMRWIRTGQVPGVKLGRDWRIDPNDLERIIEARKTKPAQEA